MGKVRYRDFWKTAQVAIKGTRRERRKKARKYYRAFLRELARGEKSPTETKENT